MAKRGKQRAAASGKAGQSNQQGRTKRAAAKPASSPVKKGTKPNAKTKAKAPTKPAALAAASRAQKKQQPRVSARRRSTVVRTGRSAAVGKAVQDALPPVVREVPAANVVATPEPPAPPADRAEPVVSTGSTLDPVMSYREQSSANVEVESSSRSGGASAHMEETPEERSTDHVPAGQPAPPATPVVVGLESPPPLQEEIEPPVVLPPPAAPMIPTVPPREAPAASQLPLLFECAWEVCWQLGGIYTVLRTKADAMQKRWQDRYFLIGPYNPSTAALEFEEQPTQGFIRQTLDRLRDQGIPCHYGRWLIPGRPRVILLDYRARYRLLDLDKYLMWQDHGISTPSNDGEVNEVVAFGFTVAQFFKELSDIVQDRAILAHFHEWMGGVAVPRIAHLRLKGITTVFTTHATLLGRYLASDSPDFYHHLPFINPEAEAGKYNIMPRHMIEKAAAHASTVFTTVSEVTAFEAEKLLGRAPDVILPNGLNTHRFAALHEFQNLHRQYKEKIHEFTMGHFFPAYSLDLDNTLYFFTSGRYEYRNKGMDLYIEAMHQLNQRLRGMSDAPTVVAFIITRAAVRNINVGVLQNQSMFDELRNTCQQLQEQIGKQLFQAAANGRLPTMPELLTDDAQVRLKRAIHAWRTGRQPTVVTHDLVDDGNDPILRHVRHRALFNAADDPVKIVFHPEFVTSTSPLINLDYDQFVRGCHMGIFPSYYEPWGYTPMETITMGLPTVTTDLSGFGAYVKRHIDRNEEQGVLVLDRRYRSFDDAVNQLTNYLFEFVKLNRRQRIELRNRAERLSELFDWSELLQHYNEAHELALERIGRRAGVVEVRVV